MYWLSARDATSVYIDDGNGISSICRRVEKDTEERERSTDRGSYETYETAACEGSSDQ